MLSVVGVEGVHMAQVAGILWGHVSCDVYYDMYVSKVVGGESVSSS